MTIKDKIETLNYIKETREGVFFDKLPKTPKEMYIKMEKLENKGYIDLEYRNDDKNHIQRPVWVLTKKGKRYYNRYYWIATYTLPILIGAALIFLMVLIGV